VFLFLFFSFLISVVPADRERLQADEAVGVLRQLDGVSIQPHLVQVEPDVVAGVTFAECLICNCGDLVVLQEINPDAQHLSVTQLNLSHCYTPSPICCFD